MSNHLKRKQPLTPEEQKQKELEQQQLENERYLQGRPTRMEVMNYVNALLEEHYFPKVQELISQNASASQMGMMVLQAILVQKGICTGEELEEITKAFIQKQTEEAKKKMKESAEEAVEKAEAETK